jgi:hypothetical protein
MLTELETIIINLNIAIERGELTQQEAVDLLDAFQDHEYEAIAEHAIYLPKRAGIENLAKGYSNA